MSEARTRAPDINDLLADALHQHRQGALAPAALLYAQALAREPSHPVALFLGGVAAMQRGSADAPGLLARAVAARPTHLGAHLALAEALLRGGDAPGALAAAEAAATLAPGDARAWFLRGTALGQLGREAESIRALRACLAADPEHADARLNLANALMEGDDPAGAEALLRTALAARPDLAEAWASLAHLLIMTGRPEEAVGAGEQAIHRAPDLAVAHWNTGIACLMAGNWERGWDEYEWRKRHPRHRHDFRRLPGEEWQNGTPEAATLAGRRILVLAEQGFGDAIQCARYLPALRARGAQPILACAPGLMPLLAPLAPCVDPQGSLPPYDLWVDQMTLPRLFATTPTSVPAAAGYLRADPARRAVWQQRLPPGPRIGLVWAGNPAHHNDSRRSLPRHLLARLRPPATGALANARLISLQLGPRAGERHDLPEIWDAGPYLTDWAESAAALSCLDLLICVDTALAHLAGALARPAWVLLPHAPCWRWLMGRADTPWYDSLRLFRQSAPGDWEGAIAALQQGLANLA